jgi:hypothetical protein
MRHGVYVGGLCGGVDAGEWEGRWGNLFTLVAYISPRRLRLFVQTSLGSRGVESSFHYSKKGGPLFSSPLSYRVDEEDGR